MSIVTIELNFDNINISAQVGDVVYYSVPPVGGSIGGFDFNEKSSTKLLGEITNISGSTITVEYDNVVSSAPPGDAFISFAKDKRINTSSLVGYYASVSFVNNSTEKIELFAIGSDVSESSK